MATTPPTTLTTTTRMSGRRFPHEPRGPYGWRAARPRTAIMSRVPSRSAQASLFQLLPQGRDLACELVDLACLLLDRRHCHARVPVEVHGVAIGCDHGLGSTSSMMKPRCGSAGCPGQVVLVGRQAEREEGIVETLHILRAQVLDVRFVSTTGDRAHLAVRRVACRTLQQAVARIAGITLRAETRARITHLLGGACGHLGL